MRFGNTAQEEFDILLNSMTGPLSPDEVENMKHVFVAGAASVLALAAEKVAKCKSNIEAMEAMAAVGQDYESLIKDSHQEDDDGKDATASDDLNWLARLRNGKAPGQG